MGMKRDGKKLSWARALQKQILEKADHAAEALGKARGAASDVLQKIDQTHGITDKAKKVGGQVTEQTRALDQRYGLKDQAGKAGDYLGTATSNVAKAGRALAKRSGAEELTQKATQRAQKAVVEPAKRTIKKSGANLALAAALRKMELQYGAAREIIKPYFAAEDPLELLENTRRELSKVSACLMQISSSDSDKLASQFSNAVLAKVSGAVASGSLIALVAAYGTAGTGTAIASLSGAAATNATLAWVGGLLGGGMTTGVVLTGLVAGLAAYKLLGSERRPFESLSEVEQRVVQSCWLTMAIIDEYLASSSQQFTEWDAEQLLENVLRPLLEELHGHQDVICTNLDGKNAVALRQHITTDFRRVVIGGFEDFIEDYPFKGFPRAEFAVGGLFYALLTQTAVGNDLESQLVLDALRRSNNLLSDATENELGDYLRDFSPEALRGVSSNVKGIYHELLYVHNYNATHTDTQAEVFGSTNNPGADIQIRDTETGEIVGEFQLKAVMDAAKIELHLKKHPDISVLATNEVAGQQTDPRVGTSGHDNETLQAQVELDMSAMADNSFGDRTGDAALLAAGIASTRELMEMLRGERRFPDASANVLKGTGVASAATVLTAYLFG
jgi:hypothetical protein